MTTSAAGTQRDRSDGVCPGAISFVQPAHPCKLILSWCGGPRHAKDSIVLSNGGSSEDCSNSGRFRVYKNLYVVRGSFDVDTLDMEIAQEISSDSKRIEQLYLHCKRMLNAFNDYAYIVVDCPPNKMFLTQAMLRACEHYATVTILDVISIYGMPRLLRWVNEIPSAERPRLLGYVLNAINRTGGIPGGKVYSQQAAEAELRRSIMAYLQPVEREVLGDDPCIGGVPRLDVVARFLGEKTHKFARLDFSRHTSQQPSVDDCMEGLTATLIKRMRDYHAKV